MHQLFLNLFFSRTGPVVDTLADQMDPVTQEQMEQERDYILGYLAREVHALGANHPQLTCDSRALAYEMSTWRVRDRSTEIELLQFAANGKGGCADEAALELFLRLQ
jgi:hypothetical protein